MCNFSLIGSCQGVPGKSVDNLRTKGWITKEPIGMFLLTVHFKYYSSSGPISYGLCDSYTLSKIN